MSDGMSDANAVGRLGERLESAAYDLREAIEAAENGHRGIAIDVLATVNEVLQKFGLKYELRRIP